MATTGSAGVVGRFGSPSPSASPASRYWQAPSMSRRVFSTWSAFEAFLDEYQSLTGQAFARRTSTSVRTRNQTLATAGKGASAPIPEHYEHYSRTMHCAGARSSGGGSRRRAGGEAFAVCKAQINATLKQEANGAYRVHVTKAFLVHNHPLVDREPENPEWMPAHVPSPNSDNNDNSNSSSRSGDARAAPIQRPAAQTVADAPASKRQRVAPPAASREEEPSASAMGLRDFLARMKAHQPEDATIESRLARYVKEFDDVDGNVAKIFVDEQKVLSCITMQTKNMRKAFDAFPEVLRVECTQSDESGAATNSSSYSLLSLLAHDTFGMWQFVQHAVVENGRSDSWTAAMTQFKSFNPKCAKVRAVIIERRNMDEISVLQASFPSARILLSQFHVVKDMHEEITQHGEDLSTWHKDRLCTIVQLLVYAPTQLVYQANLRTMVDVLGVETHPFIVRFKETWDSCCDMWSTHRRENVTTFGANGARRLEPTWREIQASVGNGSQRNDMTLDETIVSIQFYQAMVERNYMAKLHRASNGFSFQKSTSGEATGASQTYDDEMKLLAATVSPHACQLVFPQYAHALGRAQYRFCEPSRGTFFVSAVVLNDAFCDEPSKEFCVEEKKSWQCSCAFMVNHHLPCRHVFYIRRIVRCESIVPIDSLERRWILRNVCSFFDSSALTTDAMRVHVRDYKDSVTDAHKDPMDDENRNTIVVPPGSWEKFVAAMDVGKRVGMRLTQLGSADFDRAMRYYKVFELNIAGRSVGTPPPAISVGGAAATASPLPRRQTGRVGRPPRHSRLAPRSSATTQSEGSSDVPDSSRVHTASSSTSEKTVTQASASPREGGELPSLESLNPPVIDLQDESEADNVEGDDKERGKENGGDDDGSDEEDGGEADRDEDYEEEPDGEEEEEEEYEDKQPAESSHETRGSRRQSARMGTSKPSSPSSAVLVRRSTRSRP